MKVSPWRSFKMFFGRITSKIGQNNQSIPAIFGGLHLAEQGIMAGIRQISEEFLVSHMFQKSLH